MKHIKTLNERVLKDTIEHGGCGECQTSCQSACKTSCTVGNQHVLTYHKWTIGNGIFFGFMIQI